MKIGSGPTIQALVQAEPPSTEVTPGFIVNGNALLGQTPTIKANIDRFWTETGTLRPPWVVVQPREVRGIFRYEEELDLIHRITRLALQDAHPHLKTAVDALFLVYGAYGLREEWKKPSPNKGACLLKSLELAADGADLLGGICPGLELADSWKNGVNYVVITGGAVLEGRTPPMDELVSTDDRISLPLKIIRQAGDALNRLAPQNALGGVMPNYLATAQLRKG
jgi:hypothetical protein